MFYIFRFKTINTNLSSNSTRDLTYVFACERILAFSFVFFLLEIFAPTVVAHNGGHAGADNRQRLETAGPEHVPGVREENRSDQRCLLQILQGHHTRGLRPGGQNTEPWFPGSHQGPTDTRPETGSHHFHP